MSSAEAIMWAVEKDPALRCDFCNLTLLDRRPTDARMRATMARALEAIPRLRQRVIGAPLRIVPPEFADDPTLDLDAHVRVVAVPPPGDDRALLDLCGALAEQPLDRARPLWEFTVVDGLSDGRAALLQKIHHTITDGVGGLKLSLALVDLERDPEPGPRAEAPGLPEHPAPPRNGEADESATTGSSSAAFPGPRPSTTPLSVTRDALVDAAHRGVETACRTASLTSRVLTHPAEVPGLAAGAARLADSLRRQALVTDGARSDVMTARSLRRRFEVHESALEPLRGAATKLGGSLNDAFVTALARALGRYHERFGGTASELRLAMPVSTRRRGDHATNRFAPARVVVPIRPARDPETLFAAVHDRLQQAKAERAIDAAESLAGLVAGLPTSVLVAMTRSQTRTVDFAASNLRGSPVPLYLAGARIIGSYAMGPRTGTALNVTMMSYCDVVQLGLNIDPAAVTDVPAFMRDVRNAFDDLAAFS